MRLLTALSCVAMLCQPASAALKAQVADSATVGLSSRMRLYVMASPERSTTLVGQLVATDSAAGREPSVTLATAYGLQTVSCRMIFGAEREEQLTTPLAGRIAAAVGGAVLGAVAGGALMPDPPPGGAPRDAGKYRAAGALTGTVLALLVTRDHAHWQATSLPGCGRRRY